MEARALACIVGKPGQMQPRWQPERPPGTLCLASHKACLGPHKMAGSPSVGDDLALLVVVMAVLAKLAFALDDAFVEMVK